MSGQRVGYIRVSSIDQHPERQLEGVALDWVFTDKASAKDTNRPQLKALLSFVRAGDTIVVQSMDRLARNLEDLRQLVQHQTARGVRVAFVKEGLTFSGGFPDGAADALGDGGICRVRARFAQRTPARGDRPGEKAQRVPRT